MLQTSKNAAPAFVHRDEELVVEYSFSEYKAANPWIAGGKLWLDILFMHPQKRDVVTMRVLKSTLLLCQSKDTIEAIVHREIRHFLHQTQVKEYGTAYSHPLALAGLA